MSKLFSGRVTFKPFNAKTVNLAGINLIEASAGTGKTYSIALMVLRLIIEKKIPVKEILMVTFTKAAVAELEERIRLFVREAHKQVQSQEFKNDDIGNLLTSAITQTSHQNVSELLKNAVLFLDETSVLTIHSFCQLTLNEFAFETNQLFGAELLQDTSAILQNEVNQFWRNNVTSISTDLLAYLIKDKGGLERDLLLKAIEEHISGKSFFIYDDKENYAFDEVEILAEIKALQIQIEKLKLDLENYVVEHIERLNLISQQNTHAKKTVLINFNNVAECLNFIAKNGSKYIETLYPDILEKQAVCDAITQQINQISQQTINKIICQAINQVSQGIKNYKLRNNQLSYDDLIANLNAAILKPDNTKLVEGLQNKYKAVFIDEFQDTDRLQYQIFDTAFNTNTIVFYIGDPKQSIYAWRKADIFTYFEAQKAAHNCYGMNQNYRSAGLYIDAMNVFFSVNDAFHFKGNEQTIDYIKVDSPTPNNKGNLLNGSDLEIPITLTKLSNKDVIAVAVANQISDLLKPNATFAIHEDTNNPNTRPVKPSDIGILVRNKKDGKKIQAQLSKLGIPSTTNTDAKILESTEASYVLYFLLAVADITVANIRKALLSPFTGFGKTQILHLDMQLCTQLFQKYKSLWQNEGVFTTIKTFMADFNTVNLLSEQNAHQTLTNLLQLTELLHKTQTNKNLSDLDVINWLSRGINGEENEGDEYQQRIESDEEAVKIVTIHSSKGLEYNIVFAPYLDFVLGKDARYNKGKVCSFRNPKTKYYQSFPEYDTLNADEKIIFDQQEAQENSRLIYVAITRAVYKCFIYKSNAKDSPLTYFVDALKETNPNLITQTTQYPTATTYSPLTTNHYPLPTTHSPVNFQLLQKNWHKLSYSFLKAPYQYYPTTKSNQTLHAYDNFIFNEVAKGAQTGILLHHIFENIAFDTPAGWPKVVNNAIKNFAINTTQNNTEKLLELLNHTLNTNIHIGNEVFKLSSISAAKCLNELEFDFTVLPFYIQQLKVLEEDNIEIKLNYGGQLEGIMNGKIDLFFEHKGKYYVLDWKSNYLGNSIENYQTEAINQAMNQNNYHLQYYIYTLAAIKYLESRITNFDFKTQFGGVIYLFLRGLRNGSQTGIFVTKPSEKKMQVLAKIFLQ
ncbi:MAG: hypothetical protein EAZ51_09095 [Sphingobacteriales bacterium]|nr:MAG: hypothetical protein EAZ64_07330 [Sphingobacteriales bacterium]TAF78644.1 MAG: hypothetical protein EAZ51_09095 [Sphingobacteriales bacterium]